MRLKVNEMYKVDRIIKLHTKPEYKINIIQEGRFVKETKFFYVFDTFRVCKENVIRLEKC